jgi:hypothetical protein
MNMHVREVPPAAEASMQFAVVRDGDMRTLQWAPDRWAADTFCEAMALTGESWAVGRFQIEPAAQRIA